MKEAVTITLDSLEIKKQEIQLAIVKPFEYSRWPNDNEFTALHPLLLQLSNVQVQIDILKGLL